VPQSHPLAEDRLMLAATREGGLRSDETRVLALLRRPEQREEQREEQRAARWTNTAVNSSSKMEGERRGALCSAVTGSGRAAPASN
jgi:hypothetical protein